MPELKRIALPDIDEPPTPARVAMDDLKMSELMKSMSEIGLLNPITLKRLDLRYEIECGHRRFIAAKNLGWKEITALVYEPAELVEGASMLAENVFREDLSAAEEAVLFAEAQEKYQLDEAGLCARFHVTPDYLGDRMRLLRQDQEVFGALMRREINFSVARELNKCEDQAHRRYLLDIAQRTGYAARVIADMIRQFRQQQSPTQSTPVAPEPAASTPVADPYRVECVLCGGHKDPYNLITIQIHKWEWELILKQLGKSEGEDTCDSSGSKTVN